MQPRHATLGFLCGGPRGVADGARGVGVVDVRALVQATPVVVLDQPTTGPDLRHQVTLLALLRREAVECGRTALATLHDLSLAGQFVDRLVLLDRGDIVLDGAPREVERPEELTDRRRALRVVDVDGTVVVQVVPSVTAR